MHLALNFVIFRRVFRLDPEAVKDLLNLLLAVHKRLEVGAVRGRLGLCWLCLGPIGRSFLASDGSIFMGHSCLFRLVSHGKFLNCMIVSLILLGLHFLGLICAKDILQPLRVIKLLFLTVKAHGRNKLDARAGVYLHGVHIEGLHALRNAA